MMDSSSCLFNRVISHDLGVSIFDATSQNAYEIAQDTSRQILEEEMAAEDQAADKAFLRQLARLSLPIALQSLISTAVSYADVLILTTVDASALSAVSLAGQIIFVLTLLYAGISTGLTILGAQYWGRRDTATIGKVLGLALRLSMLSSVVFFLAMLLIPETLMRLFTPDKAVILFGIPYLRIVSAGCLAMGVSQMLLAVMKSMENTRESAWISISCLLTNILLNTLAVFVLFPGDPMRCVMGVAGATTFSRLLEAILCLIWGKYRGKIKLTVSELVHTAAWLKQDYRACTWKVQANYLVWGGALTVMSAIMGHVSTELVSAYAVANATRSLVIAACTGLASGGGILLGMQMGAGRMQLAKRTGHKLMRWSLLLGVGAGAVLLALRPLCLAVVELSPPVMALLKDMLFICAVYCIGKSFNSTMVSGVFCAGGDTRFGLICDTLAMWGVILPLGYLCAFVWRLPPLAVFAVLSLDEFVKMPFVAWHFYQHQWLKKLTRNQTEE